MRKYIQSRRTKSRNRLIDKFALSSKFSPEEASVFKKEAKRAFKNESISSRKLKHLSREIGFSLRKRTSEEKHIR